MNNLSLDYGKSLKDLIVQTLKFKRYHEFGLIPSIIFAVLLSPIFIIGGMLSLFFIVVYTFFKIIGAPVDYLTAVLHSEGKDVKHATQFIIYFIGFPTVFFFNILLSFFSILQFTLYLFISLCCQVFSLGGVEFRPFLNLNEYVERSEIPNLKNVKLNLIIKLCYLSFFVLLGIILEAINSSEGFFIEGGLFPITYFIGIILMPFDFGQNSKDNNNDDHQKNDNVESKLDSSENKEAEPLPKKRINNNSDVAFTSRSSLLGLIVSSVFSFITLIMCIVTRAVYFYRDVAFTITLTFTIINIVFLLIFAILYIIKFHKQKPNNIKSKLSISCIVGLVFSTLVSIVGSICSGVTFYPSLDNHDLRQYYGTYQVQSTDAVYTIILNSDLNINIKKDFQIYSCRASYYYGDKKYSFDVCGKNSLCLFADTSKGDFKDQRANELLFPKGKHVIFELYSNEIIVTQDDWSLSFDKIYSSNYWL